MCWFCYFLLVAFRAVGIRVWSYLVSSQAARCSEESESSSEERQSWDNSAPFRNADIAVKLICLLVSGWVVGLQSSMHWDRNHWHKV